MSPYRRRDPITTFCALMGAVETGIRRHRVWCGRSIVIALLMLTRHGARGSYRMMLSTFVDDTAELLGWSRRPHASSLTRARRLLPVEACRSMLRQLTERISAFAPRRFAHPSGRRFIGIDGTHFIVPRTRQTLAAMDRPGGRNPWMKAHHPQALTVVAVDLLKRLPLDWALLPKGKGEREGAKRLLDVFQPGDVAVLDRGYPSHEFLGHLLERKIAVVMRLPATLSGSWREVHEFLASGAKDTTCETTLPDGSKATIRLIRHNFRPGRPKRHQKAQPMVVLTTLTAVDGFPAEEIIRLYQARWGVETLLREVKVGFDIERFHARSLNGIEQEIAAVLIWIALGSTVEHAAEAGLPEGRRVQRNLCHAAATRILRAWMEGDDPWRQFEIEVPRMQGFNTAPRPGRSFPRERKAPHGRFRNGDG
jgi:hypothetical protein